MCKSDVPITLLVLHLLVFLTCTADLFHSSHPKASFYTLAEVVPSTLSDSSWANVFLAALEQPDVACSSVAMKKAGDLQSSGLGFLLRSYGIDNPICIATLQAGALDEA